jgi:hypothetical protein
MIEEQINREITFEEFFSDALAQIPLYTSDWTDYNQSDPGITILENLTAFQVLQQTVINKMTDEVQYGLLQLAGIKRQTGKAARLLLGAAGELDEPLRLPSNQRFMVGDLCFENNRPITLKNQRITDVFRRSGDKVIPLNEILRPDLPVTGSIWGDKPSCGDELYFIINQLSAEDSELVMYVQVNQEYRRNPITWKGHNPFAGIKWQAYTDKGYVNLKVKDNSECFMQDGSIRLTLPNAKLVPYTHHGYNGYAIRATLERAEYDRPPVVANVSAFLFEVWQKESKTLCYTFRGEASIDVYCDLLAQGYYGVYCRESDDGAYYLYTKKPQGIVEGRFYSVERLGDGHYRFSFSMEDCGHAPCGAANAVKVVIYDEAMMRQYHLGTILGYDNQAIQLPVGGIIPDSFSVIVRFKDDEGNDRYDFVKAGKCCEGGFLLELDETGGVAYIRDAGEYVNGELYLGSIAVTQGSDGNIDAGKTLWAVGHPDVRLVNVSPGVGGRKCDSLEQLKREFMRKVNTSGVAVTAADYERIVRETPGLCINKVKAVVDRDVNTVDIAVVPHSPERFPGLSATYAELILQHINAFRPLLTRVRIIKPEYVPVDVYATVRVKPHYTDCETAIQHVIREQVDYLGAGHEFGELLRYESLYRSINGLDCVEDVIELQVSAASPNLVEKRELDLKPDDRCLLYPGSIRVVTQIRNMG